MKNVILREQMINVIIFKKISDFWNFEKIFKIRLKRAKMPFYSFFCLKDYLENNFHTTSSQKPLQLSQSDANFYTLR
eukprot:UN01239